MSEGHKIIRDMDVAKRFAFDTWQARTGGTAKEFNHRPRSLWHKIGSGERRLENDPPLNSHQRKKLRSKIKSWKRKLGLIDAVDEPKVGPVS